MQTPIKGYFVSFILVAKAYFSLINKTSFLNESE